MIHTTHPPWPDPTPQKKYCTLKSKLFQLCSSLSGGSGMEENLTGRRLHKKTASRRPHRKRTSQEDDLKGRWPNRKTTLKEDERWTQMSWLSTSIKLFFNIEVVLHWGRLQLRFSSIEAIFHWDCLPSSLSSIWVVFHWCCLPLRLVYILWW